MESPLDDIYRTHHKIIKYFSQDIKMTPDAELYLNKLIWYVYHELDARARIKNRTVNNISLKKFLGFDSKFVSNAKYLKEENHKYFMEGCTNIKLSSQSLIKYFMFFVEKFIMKVLQNCIKKLRSDNKTKLTLNCINKHNGYSEKVNFKNFDPEKITLPGFACDNPIDEFSGIFDVQIPKLKSLNIISI
jgi:hypothetical protein